MSHSLHLNHLWKLDMCIFMVTKYTWGFVFFFDCVNSKGYTVQHTSRSHSIYVKFAHVHMSSWWNPPASCSVSTVRPKAHQMQKAQRVWKGYKKISMAFLQYVLPPDMFPPCVWISQRPADPRWRNRLITGMISRLFPLLCRERLREVTAGW